MRFLSCLVVVLIIPVGAWAQSEQRFELGVLGTYSFLREIGTRDAGVGTEVAGFGGRFVYRANRFLDLESDLILLPGNPASSGTHIEGLFGAKTGVRFEHLGFFVKARPGFMHFLRDPFGVGKPGADFFSHERASSTEPVLDVGAVVEYYTPGAILRFDLGQTIIRYGSRTVITSDFLPPMQAGGFTTSNWQGMFGVAWRF